MASYVILTGAGKSGSKRALKLFDLSPQTHCRCEPNELAGSAFSTLPASQVLRPDIETEMEAGWDRAVQTAAERIGNPDHLPSPPKRHLWPWARRLQLDRLIRHDKLRHVLAAVAPALRGVEWEFPRWLGDRAALARATPVLKVSLAPGWMPWVLGHRPKALVVNVVRHPAGFLHSYIGRWLSAVDRDENARLNRARLHTIARFDRQWASRADQIDRMSAVESELWYWRYVYETIDSAGRDNSNYLLVRDEDIVADPVGQAKRLYEFAGLDWCASVETYIDSMAAHWRSRSAPWRGLLTDEHVALVERVLAGSQMQDWWSRDETVSRYDYVAY